MPRCPVAYRFPPKYVSKVWGGRRLHQHFSRSLPNGPIGESWELCELEEFHSKTENMQSLGELWRAGKIGGRAQGPFPLLLKWLDTTSMLSLQVHPNTAVAQELGFGHSKHEAWLIAHAESDAELLAGLDPELERQEFESALKTQNLASHLQRHHPKPGQMLEIEPGTIHAIGAGFLLLEVQQPSDTTFRLYDWGRVGLDGKARPLHLHEATFCRTRLRPPIPQLKNHIQNSSFTLQRHHNTAPGWRADALRIVAALDAPLQLECEHANLELSAGDILVLAPSDGHCLTQKGEAAWISTGE